MSTEKEILENLNNIMSTLINNIYKAKMNMAYVTRSVSLLDNNYFVEDNEKIYSKIQNMFDSNELGDLTSLLSHYKYIVENKINNICEHEWIDDDIDIHPELSQRITYCKYCDVSKKC
jgi:hypothetical protein